jgi:N-acetylglutamate synthase-like GNAT family acetyltransferase
LGKGFLEVELSDLPEQRQELYNYQRKSKALLKVL